MYRDLGPWGELSAGRWAVGGGRCALWRPMGEWPVSVTLAAHLTGSRAPGSCPELAGPSCLDTRDNPKKSIRSFPRSHCLKPHPKQALFFFLGPGWKYSYIEMVFTPSCVTSNPFLRGSPPRSFPQHAHAPHPGGGGNQISAAPGRT